MRRLEAAGVRHPRRPAPFPCALPGRPQLVFPTARAADEAQVRRRAEAEVLALGEATPAAHVAAPPGLQQALDAYAAAGTVLDEARGLPDLTGALALEQENRDALADSPGLPLCCFGPLHGRAALRTGWRPLGRRDRLDVATCQGYADAPRDHRAPETLTTRTRTAVRCPTSRSRPGGARGRRPGTAR